MDGNPQPCILPFFKNEGIYDGYPQPCNMWVHIPCQNTISTNNNHAPKELQYISQTGFKLDQV